MHRATFVLACAMLCGCAATPPAFRAPDGSVRPFARIDADIARLMAVAGVPGGKYSSNIPTLPN